MHASDIYWLGGYSNNAGSHHTCVAFIRSAQEREGERRRMRLLTRNQFCFFSPQASSQVSIPSTSAECTQVGYFVTPFWLFFWLGLWGPHKTVFKLFFLSFKRFLLFNLSSFSVPSLSLLVCSADTLPPLPILATLPLYSSLLLPPQDGPGDLINLVFPSLSLLVCSAHTLPPSQFWQPCLLALLLPFPRFYHTPNSGNPASSLSFFSFLPQDFTTLPILATLPLFLLFSLFSLPQDFITLPIVATLSRWACRTRCLPRVP